MTIAAGEFATVGVIASGVAGALTFGTGHAIVGLGITAVVSRWRRDDTSQSCTLNYNWKTEAVC